MLRIFLWQHQQRVCSRWYAPLVWTEAEFLPRRLCRPVLGSQKHLSISANQAKFPSEASETPQLPSDSIDCGRDERRASVGHLAQLSPVAVAAKKHQSSKQNHQPDVSGWGIFFPSFCLCVWWWSRQMRWKLEISGEGLHKWALASLKHMRELKRATCAVIKAAVIWIRASDGRWAKLGLIPSSAEFTSAESDSRSKTLLYIRNDGLEVYRGWCDCCLCSLHLNFNHSASKYQSCDQIRFVVITVGFWHNKAWWSTLNISMPRAQRT